jgi:hypothetical protein
MHHVITYASLRLRCWDQIDAMLGRAPIDDEYCQGVAISIEDEDALARGIAMILVQEYTQAKAILLGLTVKEGDPALELEEEEIEDIVKRRLHPPDFYHRDGFLFQLMMWLAAHLDLSSDDLVALPHSQASGKGQDSIVVHREDNAVVALSICEDKATENPRATVRGEVWPEIKDYEAGGRRDELRSNIIATLGLGGIHTEEATRLVRRISWDGARRYRVRVTIQSARTRRLFKDFEMIVNGASDRRRGETVHIPDLRSWMTRLSSKVEDELRSFAVQEDRGV